MDDRGNFVEIARKFENENKIDLEYQLYILCGMMVKDVYATCGHNTIIKSTSHSISFDKSTSLVVWFQGIEIVISVEKDSLGEIYLRAKWTGDRSRQISFEKHATTLENIITSLK